MEKVIGYIRVSTEEQGRSGLGLEAQRATIARMADAHDWDVTWVEDAGASGKSLNRPGVQAALATLKAGQADALVVAKLDRLSRSVHDFAGLLLVARREGWALNALDMGVDTTTSAGTMVAHVMIAVAEWERAVIGDRTSAALQAAQARGVRLGRPRSVSKDAELRVFELRAAGLSYARVAEQLNTEAVLVSARWPGVARVDGQSDPEPQDQERDGGGRMSAPRLGKRLTQREREAQLRAHSPAQLKVPVPVFDRYPPTRSARARQVDAGDVLVIERGAPVVVLEVQPAKGSGLLMVRVRAVEVAADGPTRFVGPFLPDQIVQRAVRR